MKSSPKGQSKATFKIREKKSSYLHCCLWFSRSRLRSFHLESEKCGCKHKLGEAEHDQQACAGEIFGGTTKGKGGAWLAWAVLASIILK
jgi:hypothetical protein